MNKSPSSKPPQNIKIWPDGPKLSIVVDLGCLWSFIFHQISWPAKPFALQHAQSANLVFSSQGTCFSHQLSIIISCLFRHRSWSAHFDNWCWFCSKTVDLGTPLKSSGHKNPPTPAGARHCQTRECRVWQNLSFRVQAGLSFGSNISPTKCFCFFGDRLLPAQKIIKKLSWPKSIKIS